MSFRVLLLGRIGDILRYARKIRRELTYYSHIITSPGNGKLAEEAHPIIRRLAIDLEDAYLSLPYCALAVEIGMVPENSAISKAKGEIILMSNSLDHEVFADLNPTALGTVFRLLRIKELDAGQLVKASEIYAARTKVE